MLDGRYFYRNVIISKQGKEVKLIDINDPNEAGKVLENWFGAVILLADGEHTLEELFIHFSKSYQGNVPENLKDTLFSVIERLVDQKLIVLSETSVKLPYYLSAPIEYLDIDTAKQLISEDQQKLINAEN